MEKIQTLVEESVSVEQSNRLAPRMLPDSRHSSEIRHTTTENGLAVYVSGHGFGHAVRAACVMTELKIRYPDLSMTVKTSAPEWIFRGVSDPLPQVICMEVDAPPVQNDAVTLDLDKTLARLRDWMASSKLWIEREADWLRETGIRLVLADISPWAVAAAHRAGITCAVIANFTWDWIYSKLSFQHAFLGSFAEHISHLYAQADWMFVPRPSAPIECHNRPIHVGMIGSLCAHERSVARSHLGIPADRNAILLTFGGIGLNDLRFENANRSREHIFLSTSKRADLVGCSFFDSRTVDHACLVHAADAMVVKLGYGTVTEALIHGTPILYCPRKDWPEEPFLVNAMSEMGLPFESLDIERFRKCDWNSALERLISTNRRSSQSAYGARQIVSMLAPTIEDRSELSPHEYPSEDELATERSMLFSNHD